MLLDLLLLLVDCHWKGQAWHATEAIAAYVGPGPNSLKTFFKDSSVEWADPRHQDL